MNKIFAIAGLQIRAAIKSKLVVSLVILLVLSVVGLPLSMKGDGTLGGQIKVNLYYTLGLATMILSVATLWAASGAISQEIESRQIHLVVVKPVRHYQIWLGKWLGLLGMNAMLLCFSGAIIFGLAQWNVRHSPGTEKERESVTKELLTGRRIIRPANVVDREVDRRFHEAVKAGRIREDEHAAEAISEMRREVVAEQTIVAPGGVRRWRLDLSALGKDPAEDEVVLKIRFAPLRSGTNSVSGVWSVGTETKLEVIGTAVNMTMDGAYRQSLVIPSSVLSSLPERGLDGGGDRTLVVEYRNGGREQSRTVIFDSERGVEISARGCGFASNLIRALLIILCRLALLAALGLTAGTLFSFPVATFAVFSILLASLVSHYFVMAVNGDQFGGCSHTHGEEAVPTVWQTVGEAMVKKYDALISPAMTIDAVEPLADGILIPWGIVGEAALKMAVMYTVLLGGVGVLLFRRKELALAGR